MLHRRAAYLGIAQPRIVINPALSLPQGIISEHYEPILHQPQAEGLIGGSRLGGQAVACRLKDRRIRWLSRLRHVQISRDIEVRQALIDDFLDTVISPTDCAHLLYFQISPLLRQSAHQCQEEVAHLSLALLELLRGEDFGYPFLSRCELLQSDSLQIGPQHSSGRGLLRQSPCAEEKHRHAQSH